MKYLDSGAQISPCEKYRFSLWRVWDETLPHLAFVGLNPSTADATNDDPTIRRCLGFAKSHGFGAMTMLNLWAFRATDPAKLTGDITNEEEINIDTIARVSANVARVCAVWGSHKMAVVGARRVGGGPPMNRDPETVARDDETCFCSRCGSSCMWVDCEMCLNGFDGHDCGEDSCCCEFPEDNEACEICGAYGGWMQCMASEEWCRGHPLPGHENDPGKPTWSGEAP